jgi:hypothetical protein
MALHTGQRREQSRGAHHLNVPAMRIVGKEIEKGGEVAAAVDFTRLELRGQLLKTLPADRHSLLRIFWPPQFFFDSAK